MKAISLIVQIGNRNLSNKAVEEFSMDRNFSDIANKFSMTLVDCPSVSLTDLEMYMASGFRIIKVAYTDSNEVSTYSQFIGTIFDYTCTFVGDKKKLQVSGSLSRSVVRDYSGQARYNIDWNSYFNLRKDEYKMWNVVEQTYRAELLDMQYKSVAKNLTDDINGLVYSPVIDSKFRSYYNTNSVFMKIKGPSGNSINLPIPDVFTLAQMSPDKVPEGTEPDSNYDDYDPKNKFWGSLVKRDLDEHMVTVPPGYKNAGEVFVQDSEIKVWKQTSNSKIRAFQLDSKQQPYIQLNPSKAYYAGGQLLYNPHGVDISYVIRQLCILEGWEIGNIVQTALVPCSDKFKMNNRTALEFINEVLAPMSVTPVGSYENKSGTLVTITKGLAGFIAYFKDNKFYYEPLNDQGRRNLVSDATYRFGYNIPNTPVLSFQVETKGTCFYTNPIQINALSISTGKEQTEMIVADESLIQGYNKVKGHNESLDAFFGYTYEQIADKYEDKLKNYSENTNIFISEATDLTPQEHTPGRLVEPVKVKLYSSDLVQQGLVTIYPTSAENPQILQTMLKSAFTKIKSQTIRADMTIWGNPKLSPNSLITVLNMVKMYNSNLSEEHPSSGTYLVESQKDVISAGKFTQQLSLLRSDNVVAELDKHKIDWSVPVDKIKPDPTSGILAENITLDPNRAYT